MEFTVKNDTMLICKSHMTGEIELQNKKRELGKNEACKYL